MDSKVTLFWLYGSDILRLDWPALSCAMEPELNEPHALHRPLGVPNVNFLLFSVGRAIVLSFACCLKVGTWVVISGCGLVCGLAMFW